jgi:hypothetical protein
MDKNKLSVIREEPSVLDIRMERHLKFMSAASRVREESLGEVLDVPYRRLLPKTAVNRAFIVERDGSVRWL